MCLCLEVVDVQTPARLDFWFWILIFSGFFGDISKQKVYWFVFSQLLSRASFLRRGNTSGQRLFSQNFRTAAQWAFEFSAHVRLQDTVGTCVNKWTPWWRCRSLAWQAGQREYSLHNSQHAAGLLLILGQKQKTQQAWNIKEPSQWWGPKGWGVI